MAPLPAQGKPRAQPTPCSLPLPWKDPLAYLGLVSSSAPTLPGSPVSAFPHPEGGLPSADGRGRVGSLGRPGASHPLLCGPPCLRASSRVPAASQSSGCYDSDSLELPRPEEGVPEDSGPGGLGTRAQAANGGSERSQPPRSSGLRRQAIQNWQRRPRRHSTEGEEGDVSDVGSRTTESEAEGPLDAPRPGPAMAGPLSSCRLSARPEGGSGRGRRAERGSPSRSNEVISPEILKMRAALFCIFTYLDTRTLLHAAEVCRDWRFVARHPAVWTRVLLENARVCSKGWPTSSQPSSDPFISKYPSPPPQFLAMLAQWCTQAHSLTLQNLKPRQRGKKESKEEYARSTRGCLEAGLESLLKAAGGNLLILRISHCPNILTDRSLWLASCYCRALQAVTYSPGSHKIPRHGIVSARVLKQKGPKSSMAEGKEASARAQTTRVGDSSFLLPVIQCAFCNTLGRACHYSPASISTAPCPDPSVIDFAGSS
ncbi:F-box only protein 41 [Saguinus oedipus]|uniref:F-box only protein 41 n=1 Tax=Saguinus oedipus TaxID=9490 RepID=A0ABQ9U6J5_SAGOE|nr:F-box only protein 41 [Saguinus oedipus]